MIFFFHFCYSDSALCLLRQKMPVPAGHQLDPANMGPPRLASPGAEMTPFGLLNRIVSQCQSYIDLYISVDAIPLGLEIVFSRALCIFKGSCQLRVTGS